MSYLVDRFLEVIVPIGLILAILAFVTFIAHAAKRDAERWEAFRVANECRVVAHVPGDAVPVVSTGVGPNGQVVTTFGVATTPARTAWLCKDGVTYWR